jgi:glycosyltransferase involved in cell wall biosynthesis
LLISVLVTTYHRDSFLFQALRSLCQQTYDDWEAIVVDNASSLATRGLVFQLRDPRILYLSTTHNLGECAGRNLAFSHSHGDLVCYLDDDDLLPPDSLASRIDFISRYPQCGMIYGEYARFGCTMAPHRGAIAVDSKRWCDHVLAEFDYAPDVTYYLLSLLNFVRGGTPLIRRTVFRDVGLFDERYPVYGDYELWLRIARRHAIRFSNRLVYHYRSHPGSTSDRICANEGDKRWALLLCSEHHIRRSIQFAKYKQDIRDLCKVKATVGG